MGKYDEIRQNAWKANLRLPGLGLVIFTFGNVSAADHELGVFAIKPSGIPYAELTAEQMVIVDFDGKTVEGKLRPSSDTRTHALLYSRWDLVGGIAHTHSTYATAWAQALRPIPISGTTHADYLGTDIPCTPPMDEEMIRGDYEFETGMQILRTMEENKLDPGSTEMILVGSHAPFAWGSTADTAVYHSAVLERIAHMALLTEQIRSDSARLNEPLIQKHWKRKHGPDSYYGQ